MAVSRYSVVKAMQILNDIASRFPEAISFAAGRPPDDFISLPDVERKLSRFFDFHPSIDRTSLGQYSTTNGIILEMLSEYLYRAGIGRFRPSDLLVTNGAQEAILIALAVLVPEGKIAVTADPGYVGFTGPAEAFGFAIEAFADDEHFVSKIEERARREPRIGLVYAVPDFANPTGRVMSITERANLAGLAERYGFHILEDAAYRHYRYDGDALPTLKSFDRSGRVLYVESFAKTVLPGLRTAVVVAESTTGESAPIADRLGAVKSYVSVTTSPLAQATLAGLLLEINYQIAEAVEPRRAYVEANRNHLLRALEISFSEKSGYRWKCPEGGFFLTLETPRPFSEIDDLIACAEKAGVIVLPMNLFSSTGSRPNEIRLAFSNIVPSRIFTGIEALRTHLVN
jgi:(S)-3,5-dihydroxyphenylglycine transaminase